MNKFYFFILFIISFLIETQSICAQGKNYALIIGIDDYNPNSGWKVLKNAEYDAKAVARVLEEVYGFKIVDTVYGGFKHNHIKNENQPTATRERIFEAIENLAMPDAKGIEIGEEDNLIIYYAGHGYLDTVTNAGYWVPQDARQTNTVRSFISSHEVRSLLSQVVKAKHIFLIVDACFSGAILHRGVNDKVDYSELIKKRSIQVLTSSGLTLAQDGDSGEHSPFARCLLEKLESNPCTFEAEELSDKIVAEVGKGSKYKQKPVFGTLAGDEGGSLVFKCMAEAHEVQGRTYQEIIDGGILKVGFGVDPPMFYYENEKPKGFEYELAQMLAQRMGIQVEVVNEESDDASEESLKLGKIDIALGGYIKYADAAYVDFRFSNPYLDAGYCLVLPSGSSMDNLDDLKKTSKGMKRKIRIGIWKTPYCKKWIEDNIPNAEVIEFQETGWFQKHEKEKLDAIINETPYALSSIANYPTLGLKIVEKQIPDLTAHFAIMINKKSGDNGLTKNINEHLEAIKKTPEFKDLVRDYITNAGAKLDCQTLKCQNGGREISTENGCKCDCPKGFEGDNCEKKNCDKKEISCIHGVVFQNALGVCRCKCESSGCWSGDDCGVYINHPGCK